MTNTAARPVLSVDMTPEIVSTPRVPAGVFDVTPEPGALRAARAVPADAPALAALIDHWAAEGLTISRTVPDLAAAASDFSLAVRPARLSTEARVPEHARVEEVVACGAAHLTCSGEVAEIRSVAVSGHASGLGAGRVVMEALIDRSRDLGTREVVLLTRIPGFFERFGFVATAIDDMPPCYLDALSRAHRATAGRTAMRLPLR